MEIEVRIDSGQKTPKVVVLTERMTDEVASLVKRLSDESPQMIAGFQDDTLSILEPQDIIRVYAAAGKVYAATPQGEYTLKLRLYEAEERLDKKLFVRISNSEVINLKRVKAFDLSFTGTICVALTDGTVTYVSRRYVAKIKKVLGL